MDMNTEVKTDLILALQNTAMLAGFRTKSLGLLRTHKGASGEVNITHQATADAATVRVNRLAGADTYHRKIVQLQGVMRKIYDAHTLPWDNGGGWRLLPNVNFFPLLKALRPTEDEIKKTIAEYSAKAPEIIAQAQRSLGSLAADIPLPTVEEISSAYMAKMEYGSIPDTSALKNLPANVVDKLSQHMQARAKAAYDEAMQDVQERIETPLKHLIDRLAAFEQREQREVPEGERDFKGVFRDTTVTNITDLAHTLPSLNVLGDPAMSEMVDGVVALSATLKAETLRASAPARLEARAKAQEILARMGVV